jgi:ribosomal protein S18 acetylase RimI-like enzyme
MTAGEQAQTDEMTGEAIAKTYSTYYIRECTDTCFVLADDTDKAVGYILCEPDYKRYSRVFRRVDVPEIKKISKKEGRLAFFLPVPCTFFGKSYPAHMHIDILPEYQNKGYGSMLLNALLKELESRSVKGLMLTAGFDNAGAIRFYKRNGFKTVIKSKTINAIIMAKRLK